MSSRPRLVRLPWGAWVNPDNVIAVSFVQLIGESHGQLKPVGPCVGVQMTDDHDIVWAPADEAEARPMVDECARIINGEPDDAYKAIAKTVSGLLTDYGEGPVPDTDDAPAMCAAVRDLVAKTRKAGWQAACDAFAQFEPAEGSLTDEERYILAVAAEIIEEQDPDD